MNPAAAAPMSQEPVRRFPSAAVGTARSTVMVVISLPPFVLQDDTRSDPIAVRDRCNKVVDGVVLCSGGPYAEIRHRDERRRHPRSNEGGLPGDRHRGAPGSLL